MGRRRRGEAGAASLETSAAIAVAAVLVIAVVGVFTPAAPLLSSHGRAVVCSVVTRSACPVPAASGVGGPDGAAPPVGGADTGGRTRQEGGAARDRTAGSRDESPADQGTAGTEPTGSGLGDPVTGTTVPEPQPPPWSPADVGSGPYDVEKPTLADRAKELLIETMANAVAPRWPNASRNLLHFLANTGEPLQQDVDRMLADVPRLASRVSQQQQALGQSAVKQARKSGSTMPVTYPVNTGWGGFDFDQATEGDWFLALGSMTYDQTGQVTVYPPSSPDEPWRYEVDTRINVYDQYNWDGTKATVILGHRVDDSELQRLHRVGLAREYRNQGRSTRTRVEGEVP